MNEEKFIYLDAVHSIYKLGEKEIENFISMYLFPISLTPPLTAVYLKEKHALLLHYLSDYILKYKSNTLKKPISKKELNEIIFDILKENGIDIRKVQEYDDQELLNWRNSKFSEFNGDFKR